MTHHLYDAHNELSELLHRTSTMLLTGEALDLDPHEWSQLMWSVRSSVRCYEEICAEIATLN